MKTTKYIKTLALALTVGLGLVSCNDSTVEDYDTAKAYPAQPSGYLVQENITDGAKQYSVNFTKNAKGESVCDITVYDPASPGQKANVFSGGKYTYDSKTGIVTVEYAASPYSTEAVAYVNYQLSGTRATVALCQKTYAKDSTVQISQRESFVAAVGDPASQKSIVYGDWQADGLAFTLNDDSTAIVTAGTATTEGTYTWDGKAGTITAGGTTYQIALNAEGQLTVGGDAKIADHVLTVPKNDWTEVATGKYHGMMFKNPIPGLKLEYSPSRKEYRIDGWFAGTGTLTFYWTKGEYVVKPTASQFDTGYDHPQYGRVYAKCIAIDNAGNVAAFQDDVFYFGFNYVVSAGSFGSNADYFEVDSWTE